MKSIDILIAGAMLALCGCSLEPMEMPQEELFMRGFVKKFGLVDPDHTWNQAVSSEVTLKLAAPVQHGTISALADGKYYRVAQLTDVSGSITIPLDITAEVTTLRAELDGTFYFTTPGGTIDTSELPGSRTFIESSDSKVTISDCTDRTDFPVSQVHQIFNVLPEHGPGGRRTFPGNLDAPGIKTDFLLYSGDTGKDITVYPVYWNTCQTHDLGIYYFDVTDPSQENASTIKRIPFYQMRKPAPSENLVYHHSKTNSGLYEYYYYGTRSGTEAMPWIATGNYSKDSKDRWVYTNSTNALSGLSAEDLFNTYKENVLKFGTCADAVDGTKVPSDTVFYALRKGVGEEHSAKVTDDSYPYLGRESGEHDGYYRVPVLAENLGANSWDNQFRIHLPRPLEPGEKLTLKFDCRLDATTSGVAATPITNAAIQLESVRGGYIDNIGSTDYTTSWSTHTYEFTIPDYNKAGALADRIVFCLNYPTGSGTTAAVNTYCFDNIELWINPFQPIYKMSEAATPDTYRPISEREWTQTITYYADDNTTVLPHRTQTKTVTNNIDQNAHLLMKIGNSNNLYAPLSDEDDGRCCSHKDDPYNKVSSKGINIHIPANTRYGFYIRFDDMIWPRDKNRYVYSEVKGNWEYLTQTKGWADYDLEADRRKLISCAMFDQVYNDQMYTYLTFEDWVPNRASKGSNATFTDPVGDYDLNDLAFLVTGINLNEEIITEEEEGFDFLICAEDLGSNDDFDFNDLIVGVKSITEVTGSETKKNVTFTALSAGGILPVYLHYNDGTTDRIIKPEGCSTGEWHQWFGIDDNTVMINTGTGTVAHGKSATIEVSPTFELSKFGRVGDLGAKGIGGIYLTVYSGRVRTMFSTQA